MKSHPSVRFDNLLMIMFLSLFPVGILWLLHLWLKFSGAIGLVLIWLAIVALASYVGGLD